MSAVAPVIGGLGEAAIRDANLRAALRNAATRDDVIRLARERGHELTGEEIAAAIKASQYPVTDLDEAELEVVANNARTETATCANSCGCNSTETCSNCCRR